MKVSVWDTYIKREDGKLMHFDILVPSDLKNEAAVLDYGKSYLRDKPFKTESLTSKECRFCHINNASEEMISKIQENGYMIIELENCI